MKYLLTAALLCVITIELSAQQRDHYPADAFVVSRIAQKYHVQPRAMDETFSMLFFDRFFSALDEEKLVFTTEDMTRLLPYRTQLANEVRAQQNGFLKTVTAVYAKRINTVDSLLRVLQQLPFVFTADEKLTVAEDKEYPANTLMQQQKLVKYLKKEMLDYMIVHADLSSKTPEPRLKKVTDSLEQEARKKVITYFQRGIKRMMQGAKTVSELIGNLYCQTLASTFDPHSAYMPKTEKENFEGSLGQKSMRFGFTLERDEDNEGVLIHDLKPGSAAYKSGQLNPGDKIISVQWDDKQPIDVSEAGIEELSQILDQSNYGKMTLTIKKADGVLRKVEMQKEVMESDDEEDKVKSFLLKSAGYNLGYISLPAFYTDWENERNNIKGCANDVAKEILRLKKENINGLILDLRYNGGGSLQEAVDLSGIFIDAGPVTQISTTGGKTYTLKDVNRGTIYDGPLVLLVNGASASASELVAGTLQDYHRAVIMGTRTYGKATGQVIMPLDSMTRPDASHVGTTAQTFIKLTVDKLYRITGATAQGTGVIPDIQLPDLSDEIMPHESSEPTVLLAPRIDANRFYTPYAGDSVASIVYRGRGLVDTSAWYKNVKKNIQLAKDLDQKTDISLKLKEALLLKEKRDALTKQIGREQYDGAGLFSVQNPVAEEQKIKLTPGLKMINDQWRSSLLHDPWIATAFQSLSARK
jgi:carboxyl-terminal processing protease